MTFEKVCAQCGKPFVSQTERGMYCSNRCKYHASYERCKGKGKYRKVCPHCGKEFWAARRPQVYCSNECRFAGRAKKWNQKPSGPRKCEYCGQEFLLKTGNQRFCSFKCQQKSQRERELAKLGKVPGQKREVVCPICGKTFSTMSATAKFCSNQCKDKNYYNKYHERRKAGLEMKEQSKAVYAPERPRTEDTLFFVHKWSAEGMTAKEIANLLCRSERSVKEMLAEEISALEKQVIKKYFLPIERVKR